MNKISKGFLFVLIFILLLSGCNANTDKNEPDENEIIDPYSDYELVIDIPEAVAVKGRDYQWYGDDSWANYIIEADISNLTRDGDYQWWNFQFRLRSLNGEYYYTYINSANIVLQESITWGTGRASGISANDPLTGTVHYKFVVDGNTVTCYTDHNELPLFMYTNDSDPIISEKLIYGGLGWAVEDAACTISNFKIYRKKAGMDDKMPIDIIKINTIKAPVAGVYPQGIFKNNKGLYLETLEWNPAISDVFQPNTEYYATITLEPGNPMYTFGDAKLSDIQGIPADKVKDISIETINNNLVINIAFEKTENEMVPFGGLVFEDNFDGTDIDLNKWQDPAQYEMFRQGRSAWVKDLTFLDGEGHLILGVKRDPETAERYNTPTQTAIDNFISGGALRSRSAFENSYGYYEASIKFPVVKGTWGAFWLYDPIVGGTDYEGVDGTEIDIIESIGNEKGISSSNIHWNGYGEAHKSVGSGEFLPNDIGIDIYDGEFHTFAVDWSPTEYVFYIDDKETWRVDGGENFENSGICQNPLYIKLSIEGAEFAGAIPDGWDYSEMIVDYVRVYNQPKFLK